VLFRRDGEHLALRESERREGRPGLRFASRGRTSETRSSTKNGKVNEEGFEVHTPPRRDIAGRLERDGRLAPGWTPDEAADLLWAMLSIRTWEQLTTERGWSTSRYVDRMQELTKRAFVRGYEGA
jgi:hypothetical protein